MVKQTSSRDSSIKKRRKAASTTETEQEVDVYKQSVDFEEKEALSRETTADAKIFFDTCKKIKQLLFEIKDLKAQKGSNAVQTKIEDKKTEACLLLTVLKKLNRYDKFRCLAAREGLAQEKQKADSTHLQLQNLLYETEHLMSECNKCMQYKSKNENFQLISVEDFLRDAPEDVTKKFKEVENRDEVWEHEVYLARLEWELTERKNLAELCNTFEKEKKELASEIVSLKNRLKGLGPRLTAILEATKPLQEHFGMPIDKTRAEHKLAKLLPDPLYLLYANVDAYCNVYKLSLTTEIIGDQEEANQFKEQDELINQTDLESEHENDNNEAEENVEVKKRHRRKPSRVTDRQEEKRNRLLKAHPLSVEINMTIKDGPKLKMKFQYFVNLKIVTVMPSVTVPGNITGNTAREVLMGENMISELIKDDLGTESPNPSNHYQLQKVGFTSYKAILPKLGYAYGWAQKMCGLDFLNVQKNHQCSASLSQAFVETVIKALNLRLKSRTALAKQLQQLDQNLIPIIPDSIKYPKNAVSTLTKWTSARWSQVCQLPSAEGLVENELITPSDMFYNLSISRPTATLQAFVVIKNDYPVQAPIFLLNLNYNGSFHASNSDDIRDMERTMNVDWEHDMTNAGWLLSLQLRHLCAYLDIYLETTAGNVFPQTASFFKKASGRNRRKPFRFRKIGIFTPH